MLVHFGELFFNATIIFKYLSISQVKYFFVIGIHCRCEVFNPVLNEEKQSTVNLVVNLNESVYGPEILDTFPTDLVLGNETLNLYCLANGNPRPSADWIRYIIDTDHPAHDDHQEVNLGPLIQLNQANGSSTYTCVVANSIGLISVSKVSHLAFHKVQSNINYLILWKDVILNFGLLSETDTQRFPAPFLPQPP